VNRLVTLIGRIGTVLMAVGLALVLVSLIPTGQETYGSSYSQVLAASHFSLAEQFISLSSQRGIHVKIQTDNELRIYVYANHSMSIMSWISEHLPDPNNYSQQDETFMLDAFLGNHTQLVESERNVVGIVEFDYIPSRLIDDVTLIFANYGGSSTEYQHWISIIRTVGPGQKLQTIAEVVMPLGLVLAAPWVISATRRKRSSTTKKEV